MKAIDAIGNKNDRASLIRLIDISAKTKTISESRINALGNPLLKRAGEDHGHASENLAASLVQISPLARRSAIMSLQKRSGNRVVNKLAIQTKLYIGKANDKYEQEADQVASRVASLPIGLSIQGQKYYHGIESNNKPIQRRMIAQQSTWNPFKRPGVFFRGIRVALIGLTSGNFLNFTESGFFYPIMNISTTGIQDNEPENHPRGKALVKRLIESPKTIKIIDGSNRTQPNATRQGERPLETMRLAGTPGRGTDVTVFWNPNIPVAQSFVPVHNAGQYSAMPTPPKITLGHELIHADKYSRGYGAIDQNTGQPLTGGYTRGTNRGENRAIDAPLDDIFNIGLPGATLPNLGINDIPEDRDAIRITENDLRTEQDLSQRIGYVLQNSDIIPDNIRLKAFNNDNADDIALDNSDLEKSVEQARGNGLALKGELRDKMEMALGADFSSVRIHNDSHADRLSRSIQARAFTTGNDIFLRNGEYQPESSEGKKLLAHELVHVVQQGNGLMTKREKGILLQRFVNESEVYKSSKHNYLERGAAKDAWKELEDIKNSAVAQANADVAANTVPAYALTQYNSWRIAPTKSLKDANWGSLIERYVNEMVSVKGTWDTQVILSNARLDFQKITLPSGCKVDIYADLTTKDESGSAGDHITEKLLRAKKDPKYTCAADIVHDSNAPQKKEKSWRRKAFAARLLLRNYERSDDVDYDEDAEKIKVPNIHEIMDWDKRECIDFARRVKKYVPPDWKDDDSSSGSDSDD